MDENAGLRDEVDDVRQYIRRSNMRIYNVPTAAKENKEDVRKKVVGVINKAGLDISEAQIDRAHRIGYKNTKNDIETQPIIVKFLRFGDRTKFYRARKDLKKIS